MLVVPGDLVIWANITPLPLSFPLTELWICLCKCLKFLHLRKGGPSAAPGGKGSQFDPIIVIGPGFAM